MNKFTKSIMILSFVFLYLPLIIIVCFSFNSSNIVSTWKSFSVRWYIKLFQDKEIIEGLIISLKVASISATISTILGTLAGLSLARFPKFKGKYLFQGMISAPFIMPEVITGFSLLLLFVSFEQIFTWFSIRGLSSIILAHVTIGMAYVAVLTQVRLSNLNKDIEEAATDLGARPLKVFFVITLPMISPSLIAGWILSFTLSLDDVVLASFTSGPGSSTLPMILYSRIRLGVSPEINALATVTIIVVSLLVSLALLMLTKRKTLRRK